ncbi:MAG: 1-acyl-sn-glycerol-3-phosphate acyltransferase [Clostridia bacterium]|nr:1-acyl-sn-glycerol-3-phosphate acyltransferase [Clostridia bacterium]
MARARAFMWYGAAIICLIVSYPTIFYARYLNVRGKFVRRNWYANVVVSRLCRVMFYMTGSRIKIEGRENIPLDAPCLFVSNHQGHLDSVIIQGFIKKPKGFVSITQYERVPILGSWMAHMGSVFIDRNDIRQTFKTITSAADNISLGHSMVVFPEGKLNDGKETFEFQKGWLKMVRNNPIAIVPVTIKGSYKILSYNGKSMRPARIECFVSPPIYAEGMKKGDEENFLLGLRNTILEKL